MEAHPAPQLSGGGDHATSQLQAGQALTRHRPTITSGASGKGLQWSPTCFRPGPIPVWQNLLLDSRLHTSLAAGTQRQVPVLGFGSGRQ